MVGVEKSDEICFAYDNRGIVRAGALCHTTRSGSNTPLVGVGDIWGVLCLYSPFRRMVYAEVFFKKTLNLTYHHTD